MSGSMIGILGQHHDQTKIQIFGFCMSDLSTNPSDDMLTSH
jgi:hypothetical protein